MKREVRIDIWSGMRGRSEIVLDEGAMVEIFSRLRKHIESASSNRSIGWYEGLGSRHFRRDYSTSVLLRRFGLLPVSSFMLVSVDEGGLLEIEMLVRCDDGCCYSRAECQSRELVTLPSLDEIRERSERLRSDRVLRPIAGDWCGMISHGIREISIREIFAC